ncbi:MAG TPA: tail fiber domain-containing protein [Verrucomicrobiae bacterium]|jgi:hypothetical protein|nr:tail fiber domain-containing protein [Verrucomicrobiae bacterium]
MKTKWRILFLAIPIFAGLQRLSAQGTAFTYQGRLDSSGTAASGLYDFRFRLFTDASGNTQAGGTVLTSGVPLSNGLFTVTMDFGPGIFTGSNYWLEIDARTNGASSYVNLSPLQLLTPAPYAIFAEGASNVLGVVASAALSGTYSSAISFNNASDIFTGNFSGNGAGLTGVNAVTLGGLASSNFWQTAGNTGTTPGLNFLGTSDNRALELRVNGLRALRLDPASGGAPNLIGGSPINYVSNGVVGAMIGGGGATNFGGLAYSNSVTASFGAVSGGLQNTAGGEASFVGGGIANVANGIGAVAAGGAYNMAGVGGAVVVGGQNNTNSGGLAIIVGGNFNYASGDGAFLGGGGFDGHVSAGNKATGAASVVVGGLTNLASNTCSTIVGGSNNISGGVASTLGGGFNNTSSGTYATVAGGYYNTASGSGSVIGGGSENSAGDDSTIAGGDSNSAGVVSAVGGGYFNNASGLYSVVAGGQLNRAAGSLYGSSAVGGGYVNQAGADLTTVSGGYHNDATAPGAFIGGGGYDGNSFSGNSANGAASVIAGGFGNETTNSYSTVGGGMDNSATGEGATVAGGLQNFSTSFYTTVGGGVDNSANGVDATVPGGYANTASGAGSFAAGIGAIAQNNGSFVWSDGENTAYYSDRNNQFKIQAGGGVRMDVSGSSGLNPAALYVNSTSINGVGLFVAQSSSDATAVFTATGTGDVIKGFNGDNGGDPVFEVINNGDTYATSFNSTSDRNVKENFEPADPETILDKVLALPISVWNFKTEKGTRHIGPMAQDFHAAFHVGGDDRHIATVDEEGVALAAVQGLNRKVDEKDALIRQQAAQIEDLKSRLEKLEKRLDEN